ncbi:phage tail fiber protein [Pseudomonas aeruginosa]|uniref:phage tail fiber domain-containing protein n=1 Tax=Pseudomonas aeruginosa TaxID=287 RepID=UPI0023AA0ABC|nr:phage tail fiber protein [Pseudomonas aeruginosa]MDE5044772.1 phage tail fiber protein [Pseudomonas aeruginosa]
MTVETTDSIVEYTGNGVTTAFPVPFEFPANEDLVVTQVYNDVSTVLVLGTDYLVVGAGAQAGGAVITTVAPPIGAVINISRELEALQKTDLRNQGRYFAETHESVFDYLTMLIQQGFSGLSRALRRPLGKDYFDAEGRRIANVANPTENQDAANKQWTEQYVGSVVGGIQGPINNAANILYLYPDGTPHVVQDLSKSDGASGIGWKQRTVADRLNDTANVKDYGAIADGAYHPLSERFATLAEAQAVYPHATALTDSIDWAAYQAAINSGAPHVHAPGGHYVMNRGTLAERDIRYTGDGYATRVDFSLADGPGSCMLTQGELVQIGDLSVSVVKGARTLTFAAAPDLAPGDVVIVYNPANGSWLADRDPYRAGEMWKVHSVSGSTVTIYGNSSSVYLFSEVDVYRMRGVRVSVDQMHFSPSDTYSIAPFKVVFGDGVKVSNYYASDVTLYTGLEVERCFDVSINAVSSPNRSPAVNDEYGITISNCHNFSVYGGYAAATRHAVALGGMDAVCCVPNRNGLIYGMHIEGIDIDSDIGAGDMHGNADKITYDNCEFRNGVILQGRDATVRNSTIYGVSSVSGEALYGTEVYGGTYTIENNRFISYGNGASFGIIHISPGTSQREALLIIARNNTFELPNATGSTKVLFLRGRNSPLPCSVNIDGMHVHMAPVAMQCFLFADDQVAATLNSNYLIIDGVYGPSGTYLLYPTSKNAAIPTRQMHQSGAVNVTTTASATVAAPAQTIRYPYSKIPNVSVQVSSQSGGDQSAIGSITPVAIAYNVQPNSIRPAIMAPSGSFAAGGSARLHWSASLDDI